MKGTLALGAVVRALGTLTLAAFPTTSLAIPLPFLTRHIRVV